MVAENFAIFVCLLKSTRDLLEVYCLLTSNQTEKSIHTTITQNSSYPTDKINPEKLQAPPAIKGNIPLIKLRAISFEFSKRFQSFSLRIRFKWRTTRRSDVRGRATAMMTTRNGKEMNAIREEISDGPDPGRRGTVGRDRMTETRSER